MNNTDQVQAEAETGYDMERGYAAVSHAAVLEENSHSDDEEMHNVPLMRSDAKAQKTRRRHAWMEESYWDIIVRHINVFVRQQCTQLVLFIVVLDVLIALVFFRWICKHTDTSHTEIVYVHDPPK